MKYFIIFAITLLTMNKIFLYFFIFILGTWTFYYHMKIKNLTNKIKNDKALVDSVKDKNLDYHLMLISLEKMADELLQTRKDRDSVINANYILRQQIEQNIQDTITIK